MRAIVKYLILVQAVLAILAAAGFAETFYVGNVMKVTLRTGAGVKHKIVSILKSGESLEMLEYNNDWSRVRMDNGKEGWVLTRFLTEKVPLSYIVDKLKKENRQYSESIAELEKKNKALVRVNDRLKGIEEAYNRLKKESAKFLALEKKYKKATSRFKEQQDRIRELEKSLGNEEIKWFLSGSGVLVAGVLLGLSARKKKQSSLL
ncbi:MAG: TIGR04211 family SH3 domain-containing protein [Desulfobacteraceae bacterium]